jgi:quinol monooxygenase YgiN
MEFVQIIEVKTSQFDELEALRQQWLKATEGTRTNSSELICQDRDNPGTYLLIIQFPSYEAAMANNDLPATQQISEGLAALAEEPPVFRNLDLVIAG